MSATAGQRSGAVVEQLRERIRQLEKESLRVLRRQELLALTA